MMFDHLGFTVRDLAKTRAFYTAALEPPGFAARYEQEKLVAFGRPGRPQLWFYEKANGPTGIHIALAAESRAQVNAFHAAALAAGGKGSGAPARGRMSDPPTKVPA